MKTAAVLARLGASVASRRRSRRGCLARPQSGGGRSHPAAEPLEARTLLALTALGPLADAYVRDGTYAATNFGTAAALDVKSSTVADTTRITYLKFDLAAFTNPASVKLRLHGALSAATPAVSLAAKGVANTTWSESTITYNNRPAPSVTVLATQTVSSATAQWFEWDVTTYARSEKQAGRNVITLAVDSATAASTAKGSRINNLYKLSIVHFRGLIV